MICTDNIIGYKDCGREFRFYLDDYGISLNSASKVNDDKFTNAKAMLDTLIAQSWTDTFADITFDGMQANKILNDVTFADMDLSGEFTGTKKADFLLDKDCELGSFYLSELDVYVKTGGATAINLIQGTSTTVLYNDTPENNDVIQVALNAFVADSFSIEIVTEGVIYTGIGSWQCRCNEVPYYTMDGDIAPTPFVLTFQVRCNKSKHLCKYVDLIAPIVINKILGKFWFKVKMTDVFSNYVNSTSDQAIANMVYYDSQYRSIVDSDVVNKAPGQYQIGLARLNLPKPTCQCCMECNTVGWTMQSMKP